MKELKEKSDSADINVVHEFDYSTQSDSYNKKFIEWRKNKNNIYAYNFCVNSKESVYIDGQGFVNSAAEIEENAALSRLLRLLGIILLIASVFENVVDKIAVLLLDLIGVNVHYSFYKSVIYGGCTEVAAVVIVIMLLKLVVPAVFAQKNLKMPKQLAFPFCLRNYSELVMAISSALIVSAALGIPSAYSDETKEIYTFFKTYNADVSLWGQKEYVIYVFFDVIIVSFLYELLFRGCLFTALRQFGDRYAIIITSIAAGLAIQDLRIMPEMILISAVAGISLLRSGTMLSPIIVHVIYKMYMLALTIIEMDSSPNMVMTRNIFMCVVLIVGIIAFSAVFFRKDVRNRKAIADYTCHTTIKKQVSITLKNFTFMAAAAVCLLAEIAEVLA